ncbi:DUF5995 family protein [Mycolicibacterium confluentis]|uniref:Uncharacterized protein n=1 Tax=Mycolicibacterium confluentis TaxID=28047 RepID=A0A7I7XSM1_9MYCO|nr:DUF5995 family protein [Mycolicibacterium confluentis]MCV7321246.1 hypothetical protein [Mycolicibacterium confluentis]ORV25273.1 hypothetical protein AWB99_22595 [Mycolicibacterium confluentis]BBZ32277.1 hypothetical protein MCNF_08820 [Mycolicibacterium confluentis]
MQAKDIEDVLDILATIVADTKRRRDPLGYFAALYRQVTLRVRDGIELGIFEDGPRMSRFDAKFANAYFAAYDRFQRRQRTSRSWQFAFEQARADQTIILQDLLLGINAHINLDLGVVTGSEFKPAALPGFRTDFDEINEVLASLIPLARKAVEEFSPKLAELTAVGGPDVALALNFSVDIARDEAWRAGTLVSNVPGAIRPLVIDGLDNRTKLLGRVIANPPEPIGTVVRRIRRAESTDVVGIITALDSLV